MTRFGAFLIHLGISFVIFLGLAALLLFVWYPDFFFASDGGWQGIRIIALVDLVLGPTLTLIVFNPKKPAAELARDLSVIGVIQIACLLAGTYVVYTERPLALVYLDGHFYSMSADDYRSVGVPVPDFDGFAGPAPKRIVIELPDDPTAQSSIRGQALHARRPLRTLTSRYSNYAFDKLDAADLALPDSWVAERNRLTGDIDRWLRQHGGDAGDYAFFPFGARYDYLVLGVRRDTGAIVDILDTGAEIKEQGREGTE
ncbi:MAG: hypothetical protein RIC56_13010 [Pseudomonadales bacterium]